MERHQTSLIAEIEKEFSNIKFSLIKSIKFREPKESKTINMLEGVNLFFFGTLYVLYILYFSNFVAFSFCSAAFKQFIQ